MDKTSLLELLRINILVLTTILMVIVLRIYPLAFDSFGVRSQATLVKIGKMRIVIDPSVALGPKRYGLPPAEEEYRALEWARRIIMRACSRAEYIIVTHYHYDHHPHPDDDEMYEACFRDKIVYAKHFADEVTDSAKQRGKKFLEKVKDIAREVVLADGKRVEIGDAVVEFSPPVWHGAVGSKVGRVIMVYIKAGKDSFLHGSDAQNLADPAALKWVLEKNPKFIIIDGYPTILVGWRVSKKSYVESIDNVKKVITDTKAKIIILDHHIVRDKKFEEKIKELRELAEKHGKKLLTAAEYYGLNNLLLEAWRKELHQKKLKIDVDGYYRVLMSKIKF